MCWLVRWSGFIGLGLRRVWSRATRSESGQVLFSITGIALPIAILVIVTSISLGLATGGTVQSGDIDYRIVPDAGTSSPVVSVGGPKLGRVHTVSDRLTRREDVPFATPLLFEIVRLGTGNDQEYIVAIGIIPGETPTEVAGASTAGLTPGDPHYANGTFQGPWTDELILSAGAVELIGVDNGSSTRLYVGGSRNRTVRVVNVTAPASAAADFPVALVHLSELQSMTGTAGSDSADQLLVQSANPRMRGTLASVYPHATVIEKGGIGPGRVADSSLALAVALTAFAVALVVGMLFTATTLGLAVVASSRERAVLAALGISSRSRSVTVAVEALTISLAGGILGVGFGWVGIPLANQIASRWVTASTVARSHPFLVPYGLGVALIIALLILPYLLVMSNRKLTMEVLSD